MGECPISAARCALSATITTSCRQTFPDKPIVIGEAGWPSEGRTRGIGPGLARQRGLFRPRLRPARAWTRATTIICWKPIDQPWKNAGEGAVGAYWGLFDATGHPKFAFTGLLRSFPEWRGYALLAAVSEPVAGASDPGAHAAVRQTGYLVMGGLIALVSTGLLALIDATALEYIDPTDIVAMIAMSPLVLLACAIILTEGIETGGHRCGGWIAAFVRAAIPEKSPRVSIHVPTYNEPPQMVIETLNALARLDYDNYEVIVLDNNTPIPRCGGRWKRIARRWAPRFRFFHFDNVKGFKAGALNRALALTDPAATHIAVIDSDYQVEPFWLRRAMPLFRVARHRAGAGAAGLSRRRRQSLQGDGL